MPSSYDQKKLAEEVAQVLTSGDSGEAVRKIDFLIEPGTGLCRPPIRIDGAGFERVGAKIRSGAIKVKSDRDNRELQTKMRGEKVEGMARYISKRNRMVLHWRMVQWQMSDLCESGTPTKPTSPYETQPDYSEWCGEQESGPALVNIPEVRGSIVHESAHALVDLLGIPVWGLRDEAAAALAEAIYLHHNGTLETVRKSAEASATLEAAIEFARTFSLFTKKGVCLTRKQMKPLLRAVHLHYGCLGLVMVDGIAELN